MRAARRPPVRAVTLGVASRHPLAAGEVRAAAAQLSAARAQLEQEGYEVQTLRVATRPVLADLAGWASDELLGYARELQRELDKVGIGFCSLGPARLGDGPTGVAALAEMLVGHPALNGAAEVASPARGLDPQAAAAAAEAMLFLAGRSEQGLGNFRFAALACVGPGNPFFPAAYHLGPAAVTVALQGAGVVAEALAGVAGPGEVAERVAKGLRAAASPVVSLMGALCAELGSSFGGVDLSPAPGLDDSIVAAMELVSHRPLGGPGTLALAAALTAGVRSSGLPVCGYNGLMLPLMEDRLLAQRWEEGRFGLGELLGWSAVCGTGLDTVPLAGDVRPADLAALICDVGALAARLGKPLSARLLPAPGKSAGERTEFVSPYLVNTVIKEIGPPAK